MTRSVKRLFPVLVALVIMMALTAPAAAAPSSSDEEANQGSSPAVAVVELDSPAVDATFPSPNDCRGKSNYAHKSTHNPANVNGEARTYCNKGSVSYLWAEAQLWKTEWWGWDKVGVPTAASATWKYSVSAFDNTACVSDDWRVTGNHRVTDTGVQYTGTTVGVGQYVRC